MELFKKSESEEGDDIEAEVVTVNKAKPRGRAGGRTSLQKSRPDVIEGVKDWTSNTGVSAHERRRDEVGQLGFTMEDMHKFVKEKFYSENPQAAPCTATLRRLFSPPFKNRNN